VEQRPRVVRGVDLVEQRGEQGEVLVLGTDGALRVLDASGAPVYAEIAENDKIIAAAEFTNFIFGDILSPDAAQ
jgi:hypothetical protein